MDMESSLSLKFAALSDPTRRAILARLSHGDASVAELQKPFGISQPAISKHLRVLEGAGLIESSQAAQSRPRRLKPEALKEATEWFGQFSRLWSDSFDRLDDFLRSTPDTAPKE